MPIVQNLTYDAIRPWYDSLLGELVCYQEACELDKMLAKCFGFYLLQVGGPYCPRWLEQCPIQQHLWLNPQESKNSVNSTIAADLETLPFSANSLDCVLLPHVLEFTDQPEQVLHELSNVLMPSGNMIIIGFNPHSLWGMQRWRKSKELPWNGNFHSIGKVSKWLQQSECEVEEVKTILFRPPWEGMLQKHQCRFLETLGQTCWPSMGGIYIIRAKKRVAAGTPIRLKWKGLFNFSKKSMTVPTSRSYFDER